MRPQLLKVPTGPAHSFSVRQEMLPNINNRWHYHPEVELIQFHRGSGTQFVGDHISRFGPGDIVLVGADLPHYWRFDEFTEPETTAEPLPYSTVIHFTENFWGDRFLHLPENKPLQIILEKAKRGIQLRGTSSQTVSAFIEKIRLSAETYRIIHLLECMLRIGNTGTAQLLSSLGFQAPLSPQEDDRINAVYAYTFSHFTEKISLEEIASVAGLVPNSFCRYFKSRSGKTYSRFLTEIRIGYACKLLLENHLSIKHICLESGFNNFTCFHKFFKDITGKSPLEYQKAHRG